jgi:hypothetical protein
VRGVGDNVLQSDGCGSLLVTFVSPTHRVDKAAFAALYTPKHLSSGTVLVEEDVKAPMVGAVANEEPESCVMVNTVVTELTLASAVAAVFTAERNSRHSPISSCDELREKLGLHRTEVINKAQLNYHGVSKLVAPSGTRNALDDALRLGAMRKRRVNHKTGPRTATHRKERRRKKGALFHFDLTPFMVRTREGFTYAMVCVEDHSRLLFVVPLKDKTAESVVDAIEQLRVFVDSSGGGKKLEELRGDFDCAITVNGRGDDIDTEVLRKYKEKHPIRTTHSPPHTQALNQTVYGYIICSDECQFDSCWPCLRRMVGYAERCG